MRSVTCYIIMDSHIGKHLHDKYLSFFFQQMSIWKIIVLKKINKS